MRVLSTTVPYGFDFDTARFLAAARALGCVSGQFYRNPERPPTVAEALRVIERAGMRFDSMHGLFGHDIDPSSPDAAHRAACLAIYEKEARLALELGVRQVVVHPSANREDLRPIPKAERDAAQSARWRLFEDFARRAADLGVRLGVSFLIENVPPHSPLGHDATELARRIGAINSPAIRMCFDTGHAHLTSSVSESLRSCAAVIDYLHLHDNAGESDDHLMPFDGTIDWRTFAAALRESRLDVPCMLEVFYPTERVENLAAAGLGARLAKACAMDTR